MDEMDDNQQAGKVKIEMCSGVEGPCLYFDGFRMVGPKPWGGGTITHTWYADPGELIEAAKSAKKRTTGG